MEIEKLKAIVSKEEAFIIIATYAPNVQILEVVSDYYADPVSLEHHQTHQVPGFFQISIDRFEEAPLWNLKPDETMITILEEYAITPDSDMKILIYDNIRINCGQSTSRFDASARLYSVLKHVGVKHVSIIMDNAINRYFKDEYAANHPEIASRFPASAHQISTVLSVIDPHIVSSSSSSTVKRAQFVSYETMVKLVAGELGSYRLLDARSVEEYAGFVTGYEYVSVAGRIPTSESVVNADYQLSIDDSLDDVLSRLETTLQGKGIYKNDRLIWYCGTGWRAARMYALTQLLEYKNVAIYEGGWNEWYQLHQG